MFSITPFHAFYYSLQLSVISCSRVTYPIIQQLYPTPNTYPSGLPYSVIQGLFIKNICARHIYIYIYYSTLFIFIYVLHFAIHQLTCYLILLLQCEQIISCVYFYLLRFFPSIFRKQILRNPNTIFLYSLVYSIV